MKIVRFWKMGNPNEVVVVKNKHSVLTLVVVQPKDIDHQYRR